jgi:hypothetical protein
LNKKKKKQVSISGPTAPNYRKKNEN